MDDAVTWAFEFFYHRDCMNAKVHCSPVRWSPITVRLALYLSEHHSAEAARVIREA